MTTTDPYAGFGTNVTPQTEQVPGRTEQVQNNAGGFVFQIDPLTQLRRFLTIGTAGGTYYVGQDELTAENGAMLLEMSKGVENHRIMVDEIVNISLAGRAPKQNPTLFALAIACQKGESESKIYARSKITQVVRTGTHLFIFMKYLKQFGGINRGLRREIGKWYTEKTADQLAYQLVKYRQREGYTHRDVLRLTHPKLELSSKLGQKESDEELNGIVADLKAKRETIKWSLKTNGGNDKIVDASHLPAVIRGYELVNMGAPVAQTLKSIKLPWEALPDEAMNDPKVWDVMLDNGVPIGALLRQLPRLTQLGIIDQMGGRTNEIIDTLLNPEALKKARIHPFNVLVAMKTYASGHGFRSSNTWNPVGKMVEGLDEMFYASFGYIEPTRKRRMDALDVSGSMGCQAGSLPLSCYEVVAAMAMTSVRTEPLQLTTAFTSMESMNRAYSYQSALMDLPLSPRQRLDDVLASIRNLPHKGTDCALPMIEAQRRGLLIDTFVIYTDNETWHGGIHPFQALQRYRVVSGITDAKLVVVSITPTKFSIADPSDAGMLDISGFDSAVPNLISDFSTGRV